MHKPDKPSGTTRRAFLQQTGAVAALAASGNPVQAARAVAALAMPVLTSAALAQAMTHLQTAERVNGELNDFSTGLDSIFETYFADKRDIPGGLAEMAEAWQTIFLPRINALSQALEAIYADPALREIVRDHRQALLIETQEQLKAEAALARKHFKGREWEEQVPEEMKRFISRIEQGKLPDTVGRAWIWEDELLTLLNKKKIDWSVVMEKVALRYADNANPIAVSGLCEQDNRVLDILMTDMRSVSLDVPSAEEIGDSYRLFDINPTQVSTRMSESFQRYMIARLEEAGHAVTPELKERIKRTFSTDAHRKPDGEQDSFVRSEALSADPERRQWQLAVDHGFSREELRHAAGLDPESLVWHINARNEGRRR